jgi:hypothetical protein
MSITNAAVLAELNISVWTANKLDKGATANVTDGAKAVRSAAQVRKNLMAGTTERKQIADYAASCRLWHNTRTLPWADKGARLLPTSLFLDYKSEANVRKATFDGMVTAFLADYDTLVASAASSLGDLFDPSDYPSMEEVRSKFGFRLVFSPVPEAGDFRLDVPAGELEEIKQQYSTDFDSRLADAMRTPWEQLHRLLTGMSEKLTENAEGDETQRRYHDTLITNAQGLCDMLSHLNVTKDPMLETARRKLEHAMMGVSIDSIREDVATRAAVKTKLDALLSAYEW